MRALALVFLAVASCGGQVEENEPYCHEVRGYFEDNRCSRPLTFDSCARPPYAWAVRDFKCQQVRNP